MTRISLLTDYLKDLDAQGFTHVPNGLISIRRLLELLDTEEQLRVLVSDAQANFANCDEREQLALDHADWLDEKATQESVRPGGGQ
jgi:Mg-chelatase subunit ChlD